MKQSLIYEDDSCSGNKYGMEEAYLAMATYCDKFLQLKEEGK